MTNKPHFPHTNVTDLLYWIRERHNIYKNRAAGKPKPWTTDPIMQRYRFCNVYRELDTVTKWIADNWRDPNIDDQDVWFAMLVARYVNEPKTLEMIGYPVPYSSKRWIAAVEARKAAGGPVFNGAYVIPTGGLHNTGAKHGTLDKMFTRFWQARRDFRPYVIAVGTLARYNSLLTKQEGVGTFMAGQVIADLKYTVPYLKCDDWWSFAVSGPGSRRGMNRVVGLPVTKKVAWKEEVWKQHLDDLGKIVNRHVVKYSMDALHMQDLQNCLCEFDKYQRHKLGEGRIKQKYPGRK